MGFIFALVIWLLCIYLLESSEQKDKQRAEKRCLARERWEKAKQARIAARHSDDGARRVPASAVKFRSPEEKAVAFERLITWAKQEAKSKGISFDEVPGENDYRKAKQVFMDSDEWQKLRLSTIERDNECLRCGSFENLQADHVIPMVLRPDRFNEPANLQTLCGECNNWKMVKAIDYRDSDSHNRLVSKSLRSCTKKQQVQARLSLSPEQRRLHERRVAMLVVAERRVERAMREAEKLGQYQCKKAGPAGRIKLKRFSYLTEAPSSQTAAAHSKQERVVLSEEERKRREQVIKDRRRLHEWRRANEQKVINEVKLRYPPRKQERIDWYLCERAFWEAEYQEAVTGEVRFSRLGWSQPATKRRARVRANAI